MTDQIISVQAKAVVVAVHDVSLTLRVPGGRAPRREYVERLLGELAPGVLDAACTPGTIDHHRAAEVLDVLDVQALAAGGEAVHVL
ncbi:hypothetical protein [Streptomyces sp. NPDC091416]|uniref:hypothetical protein n=1 Tax=Streptomyces sp. NPDC091416 TaxID=3366003 RepID=UPI00381DB78B